MIFTLSLGQQDFGNQRQQGARESGERVVEVQFTFWSVAPGS